MLYTIEATEQEITALRQLLHRAVLHSGMDVAEAATHWNRKLMTATQLPPTRTNGAGAEKPETIDPPK
jgi:hypothetical protein